MGIRKFTRYGIETFSACCYSAVLVDGCDNLFLDFNGIVHKVTHPETSYVARFTDTELVEAVLRTFYSVVAQLKPRKRIYIAFDGPCQLAKMVEQSSRRFRSDIGKATQDAALRDYQKVVNGFGERRRDVGPWRSSDLTPGSKRLTLVYHAVVEYIGEMLSLSGSHEVENGDVESFRTSEASALFRGRLINISGINVPGEGEHKIIDYIREIEMGKVRQINGMPGDSHDDTVFASEEHVIYSADSDVVLLSLASHERNIRIVRPVTIFGEVKDMDCTETLYTPEHDKLDIYDVGMLREYLFHTFCQPICDRLTGNAGKGFFLAKEQPDNNAKSEGRDETAGGQGPPGGTGIKDPVLEEKMRRLFHINSLMSVYLRAMKEGNIVNKNIFLPNIERIIDDYIILCTFVGDDFVPCIIGVEPEMDSFEIIRSDYLDLLYTDFVERFVEWNKTHVGVLSFLLQPGNSAVPEGVSMAIVQNNGIAQLDLSCFDDFPDFTYLVDRRVNPATNSILNPKVLAKFFQGITHLEKTDYTLMLNEARSYLAGVKKFIDKAKSIARANKDTQSEMIKQNETKKSIALYNKLMCDVAALDSALSGREGRAKANDQRGTSNRENIGSNVDFELGMFDFSFVKHAVPLYYSNNILFVEGQFDNVVAGQREDELLRDFDNEEEEEEEEKESKVERNENGGEEEEEEEEEKKEKEGKSGDGGEVEPLDGKSANKGNVEKKQKSTSFRSPADPVHLASEYSCVDVIRSYLCTVEFIARFYLLPGIPSYTYNYIFHFPPSISHLAMTTDCFSEVFPDEARKLEVELAVKGDIGSKKFHLECFYPLPDFALSVPVQPIAQFSAINAYSAVCDRFGVNEDKADSLIRITRPSYASRFQSIPCYSPCVFFENASVGARSDFIGTVRRHFMAEAHEVSKQSDISMSNALSNVLESKNAELVVQALVPPPLGILPTVAVNTKRSSGPGGKRHGGGGGNNSVMNLDQILASTSLPYFYHVFPPPISYKNTIYFLNWFIGNFEYNVFDFYMSLFLPELVVVNPQQLSSFPEMSAALSQHTIIEATSSIKESLKDLGEDQSHILTIGSGTASSLMQIPTMLDARRLPNNVSGFRKAAFEDSGVGIVLKNSAYGDSTNMTIAGSTVLEIISKGEIVTSQGGAGSKARSLITRIDSDTPARFLPIELRRIVQRKALGLESATLKTDFVDPILGYHQRYSLKNTTTQGSCYVPELKSLDPSVYDADMADPGRFSVIGNKTKFSTATICRRLSGFRSLFTPTPSSSPTAEAATAQVSLLSPEQGSQSQSQSQSQAKTQQNEPSTKPTKGPDTRTQRRPKPGRPTVNDLLPLVPLLLLDLANHPVVLIGLLEVSSGTYINRLGVVSKDKQFVSGLSFIGKITASNNCVENSNIHAVCIRAYNDGSAEDFAGGGIFVRSRERDGDRLPNQQGKNPSAQLESFKLRQTTTSYLLPESALYLETDSFRYKNLINEASSIQALVAQYGHSSLVQGFIRTMRRSELFVFPLALMRGQYSHMATSTIENILYVTEDTCGEGAVGNKYPNIPKQIAEEIEMFSDVLPAPTDIDINGMLHPVFRQLDPTPFIKMFGKKNPEEVGHWTAEASNLVRQSFEAILLHSIAYHTGSKSMRMITDIKMSDETAKDCCVNLVKNNVNANGTIDMFVSPGVIIKNSLYGLPIEGQDPLDIRYRYTYNTRLMENISVTLKHLSPVSSSREGATERHFLESSNTSLQCTKVLGFRELTGVIDNLFSSLKSNNRFSSCTNMFCINSVLDGEGQKSGNSVGMAFSKASKQLNYMFGLGPYRGKIDAKVMRATHMRYSKNEVVMPSGLSATRSSTSIPLNGSQAMLNTTRYNEAAAIPEDFFFTDLVLRHIITAINVSLVKTFSGQETISFGLNFIFKAGRGYLLCNNFVYSDNRPPVGGGRALSPSQGGDSRYYYLTQAGFDAVARYFCLIPHIFVIIKRLIEGINWRKSKKPVRNILQPKDTSTNDKMDGSQDIAIAPSTGIEAPNNSAATKSQRMSSQDEKENGEEKDSTGDGDKDEGGEEKEAPFPEFYDDKIRCVNNMRGIDSLISIGEGEFIRYLKMVDEELYGRNDTSLFAEGEKRDGERGGAMDKSVLNIPISVRSLLKASRRNDVFINCLQKTINNFALEQRRRRYVSERARYILPDVTNVVAELSHHLRFSGISFGANGYDSDTKIQTQTPKLFVEDTLSSVIGSFPGFIYLNNPNTTITGVNEFMFTNRDRKFSIVEMKRSDLYRSLVPNEVKPYSVVLSLKQPTLGQYGLVVETETRRDESNRTSDMWRNDLGSRLKSVTVLWFGGSNLSTSNSLSRRECLSNVSDSDILVMGNVQSFNIGTFKTVPSCCESSLLENMLSDAKEMIVRCCSISLPNHFARSLSASHEKGLNSNSDNVVSVRGRGGNNNDTNNNNNNHGGRKQNGSTPSLETGETNSTTIQNDTEPQIDQQRQRSPNNSRQQQRVNQTTPSTSNPPDSLEDVEQPTQNETGNTKQGGRGGKNFRRGGRGE